ncbi:MAG: SUMF1/EgtB/PvdO family nonheme iron enzyme [Candidatus Hydrogenedentes bacterium]|nr:SUMF1/EgtB/PvdO family nonheme iron enzyme [Candidatus Hydrogenedentota bacterium]
MSERISGGIVLAGMVLLLSLSGCGGGNSGAHNTRVTIDSNPTGAELIVAGQMYPSTPVTIEGLVPGFNDVVLMKENFKTTDDQIEVVEGKDDTFVIDLDPLVGYLSIDSDPMGAEVWLNGEERIGLTPMVKYPLPVGDYTYQIRMENFYPLDESVSIGIDDQYSKRSTLVPMESELAVLSRPGGASIFINNQLQQSNTPAKFTLAPGSYLISVYLSGYAEKTERVVLEANKPSQVQLEMEQGNVPKGMVVVPAGEFIRGEEKTAPEEQPRTKIDIPAYFIDKAEVTHEEFKKVFAAHKVPEGRGHYPVTGVSYDQAYAYAKAVGKRLPTEEEWEKAARGTDGRKFPWGEDFNLLCANTLETQTQEALPVGKRLEGMSPYGCFDMSGNVYEWTNSLYQPYPGNTLINKNYGQIYRVLRGGSFMTKNFDARCTARHFDKTDAARLDYGFRCAMDATKKK